MFVEALVPKEESQLSAKVRVTAGVGDLEQTCWSMFVQSKEQCHVEAPSLRLNIVARDDIHQLRPLSATQSFCVCRPSVRCDRDLGRNLDHHRDVHAFQRNPEIIFGPYS